MTTRLLIATCFVTLIAAAVVKQPNETSPLKNISKDVIAAPRSNFDLALIKQLNETSIESPDDKPTTNFYPYENARSSVIEAEDLLTTGGRLQLSKRESEADKIFLSYKKDELERGFQNPEINAASMHFFKAKPLIESSKVFKFLKKMPKGALLHAHTTATVSSKWVVKNIFYMPGLLRCISTTSTPDGINIMTFRQQTEQYRCVKVSDERKAAASVEAYDSALESLINLYTPSPEVEYSTINKVWSKFDKMFGTMGDVLNYLDAYRAFHWQMLQELYDDNIMYAEVRLGFKELYDSSGRIYNVEISVAELVNIIARFKQRYPRFLGVKLIYAVGRRAENDVIEQRFNLFNRLHSLYPDYLIGFDLVGQEDRGKSLHNFVNIINSKPTTAKFFFHAGETNWYGSTTDINLLDALLLNTTRIGHGYALMKHPLLYSAVKRRDIAVEVSPISNQVLKLVSDLRNHPASFFMSQNIPIVICNDDPGFWNAKALSYDFYYAIMSLAANNAGLKTLKQLVWNSIKYSTLEPTEHQKAFALLQTHWDQFIEDVLNGRVV